MELFAVLKGIYTAMNKARTLTNFLEGGLSGILEQIADAEYQSAIHALRDSKISSRPQREIESAITCLRTAQHSFYAAGGGLYDSGGPMGPFSNKKQAILFKKSTEASALIVACYHCLKEEKLKKQYFTKLGDSYYCYILYKKEDFESRHEIEMVNFCTNFGLNEFWMPNPRYCTEIPEVLPAERTPQIDLIGINKKGYSVESSFCGPYRGIGDYGPSEIYKGVVRPPRS